MRDAGGDNDSYSADGQAFAVELCSLGMTITLSVTVDIYLIVNSFLVYWCQNSWYCWHLYIIDSLVWEPDSDGVAIMGDSQQPDLCMELLAHLEVRIWCSTRSCL